MLPLLGGLITGGASLLGSFFNNQTSASNTQAQIAAQEQMQGQTQNFNAQQAAVSHQWNVDQVAQNQAWQTMMANSAFQRATQDMKSAGINPILAAGSQSPTPSSPVPGSPTASVGTPTVPMPQTRSPWAGLGDAVSAAVSTAVSAKTFDKMTQEIANMQTQQAKTAAETRTEEKRPAQVEASTELTRQDTAKREKETFTQEQENAKRALEMPGYRVSAREAEAKEKIPQWLFDKAIEAAYLGKNADQAIAPIVNSAKGVLPWVPKSGSRSRESVGGGSFDEFWQNRTGWRQ